MKKIILFIFALVLSFQTIKAQVVLDTNGVTIKWNGTSVPSNYFVQASPRGTLEWFAIVNDSTKNNITAYAKNIPSGRIFFTPPGSLNPIPFDNIVTSLLSNMSHMFYFAKNFNQPIGSWDVSKVTNMSGMFCDTALTSFNQPIGNWNVSKVTNMSGMFRSATAFNQHIGSWNVGNVTNMSNMFENATAFNQPIGNWDVSKVTRMAYMFLNDTIFNQPIGNWNVSRVKNMSGMFAGNTNLSINNYDSLLIGWYARIFPENPLRPSVSFSAGNAKYCKGNLPRSFIISTYGWTITDGGMDCSTSIEELESSKVKLYPNPVINELNVIIDYHIIDEPYVIIDGLGRVVLEGKFKEGESTINLMELAKGIYYLKVSDSYSSKFMKE